MLHRRPQTIVENTTITAPKTPDDHHPPFNSLAQMDDRRRMRAPGSSGECAGSDLARSECRSQRRPPAWLGEATPQRPLAARGAQLTLLRPDPPAAPARSTPRRQRLGLQCCACLRTPGGADGGRGKGTCSGRVGSVSATRPSRVAVSDAGSAGTHWLTCALLDPQHRTVSAIDAARHIEGS